MPNFIEPYEFLSLAVHLPVVDARSPGEYLQGHIPGAVNIPVFDNYERAQVGATYVQVGKEPAIALGHTIAEVKTEYYLQQASVLSAEKDILLHCWRGGLRSAKFGSFFEDSGYKVQLLNGGYKAYRRYIRQQFTVSQPIALIGGLTGSGKTDLIHVLKDNALQTIDLEHIACHKGSNFGHLGQCEQPTTEQFENNLYAQWAQLDRQKVLWLEHESKTIGKVFLPDTFYQAMCNGLLLFIEVPKKERIIRLVNDYAVFPKANLQKVFIHLGPYMGSYYLHESLKALEGDDFEKVADISLRYYDKLYLNSLKRSSIQKIINVNMEGLDLQQQAMLLQKTASENIF